MRKPNRNTYIKDFDKFQLVFKYIDKNYILCSLFERIYEVTMQEKSYIFNGKCFNGWNINGLVNCIGLCMGNKKNEFSIKFINSNFDEWRNITFYGIPDKINARYVINTKKKTSKYLINGAKQLDIFRFIIDYNGILYYAPINSNLIVKDALDLWKFSIQNCDYFEYDGKPIDNNIGQSQIMNLHTIKIFTAKYRLNGGEKPWQDIIDKINDLGNIGIKILRKVEPMINGIIRIKYGL
jgi:hypothetical protein